MSADLFYYEHPNWSDSLSLEMRVQGLLELTVLQKHQSATIFFSADEEGKNAAKNFAEVLLNWWNITLIEYDRKNIRYRPSSI